MGEDRIRKGWDRKRQDKTGQNRSGLSLLSEEMGVPFWSGKISWEEQWGGTI